MLRDEALATLCAHEQELRGLGVARAAVFGSVASGKAHEGSDVDILVEIDPAARMDVYDYVGVVQYIGDLFTAPVDVANRDKLKPHVRSSVEREAVYAF